MTKIFASILIIGLAIFVTANIAQAQCTTIQDGTLYTSDSWLITPGYDEWGYNYQANMFNGGYCDGNGLLDTLAILLTLVQAPG